MVILITHGTIYIMTILGCFPHIHLSLCAGELVSFMNENSLKEAVSGCEQKTPGRSFCV